MKATGIVLASEHSMRRLSAEETGCNLTAEAAPFPLKKRSRPSCPFGLRSRLGPESNLNPRAESEIICC